MYEKFKKSILIHNPNSGESLMNPTNNQSMDRRTFLVLGAFGFAELLTGCVNRTYLKGGIKNVVKEFDVYTKSNPNLKFPHGTWKTWYGYLKGFGYNHTGASYTLPPGEPIVACASGQVIQASFRIGSGRDPYKESGDGVIISHGNGVITDYYHMKKNSRKVKALDWVKRGQIIGSEGAPHGMHFKHFIRVRFHGREQPNNYGINHGYMDYWDKKTNLDIQPEEVYKKKNTQYKLIKSFLKKYKGPDHSFIFRRYLIHQGNWSNENQRWSSLEEFKLAKYIYDLHPELFDDTKKINDLLIADIYANQPIILTLPMNNPA